MKILLITNKSPWPPRDGGSAATMSMISGIKAKGASVTILAFNTLKHYANKDEIPAGLAEEFHLVNIDTGVKPVKLLFNLFFSKKAYSLARFDSDEFRMRLTSVLKNSFDIIQVEGLAMTCYLDLIRRLTKCKVVYRPHNVENLIWRGVLAEEKSLLKRSYFKILAGRTEKSEISVINMFDALVPMTKNDLSWFIRAGLKIPSFVSPPAPLSLQDVLKKENELPLSLFYIGALDWRPNIYGLKWFIKEVWPVVTDSLPGATLHLAGRNPSDEIKGLSSGKGISFYGEVESSSAFISDKSVMIVPLFSGSGIRMKIIESMNMGKSVIATSAAVEGLEFEAGKDIFIAGNRDDFARHIITLLNDKSLRDSTGRNAIENVRKNYNILVSTENLLNFYSQLP
jgi:glycosyltransferase involved in cell wall biosynthesis